MLARAVAGVAGWGLGLEPAIVRTRSAVNTGAVHEPFSYKCLSKNPFLFFLGEKPTSKNAFLKNPFLKNIGEKPSSINHIGTKPISRSGGEFYPFNCIPSST